MKAPKIHKIIYTSRQMKLSEELAWRGLSHQTTYPDISAIDNKKTTFYWGVDPSAPSMTVGNLAAAMLAKHFINAGHKAVLLIGGATGLVGDPDGKASERELQPQAQIEKNKIPIIEQYKRIFAGQHFEVVDNYEWFKDIRYVEFLRDVGKRVPLRQMMAREFVQSRLGEGGAGISYAEFSYVLMQAYDFLHLYREHGVDLQLCGSDQWGNSIAGVDLIRRVTGKEAHVWSAPLVVNKATGVKFGKSEEGAVWLDAELTSPYSFYQFWLNVDDESAMDFLKIFTAITKDEYKRLIDEFRNNRAQRAAQKYLAYNVSHIVHGKEVAESVKKISDILFGSGDYGQLNEQDYAQLEKELSVVELKNDLTQVLLDSSLANSKSEASRLIEQGAISINGEKVGDSAKLNISPGKNILKRGKNQFAVLISS